MSPHHQGRGQGSAGDEGVSPVIEFWVQESMGPQGSGAGVGSCRFQTFGEAKAVLGDADRRAEYDRCAAADPPIPHPHNQPKGTTGTSGNGILRGSRTNHPSFFLGYGSARPLPPSPLP